MRQGFLNSLKELQDDLLKMGELVSTSLDRALTALKNQDVCLAQQVITDDVEIDYLQVDIEDKCLMLIALQQPMAKDLRILSTALKLTIDLERIGDHAKNIAEVTIEIGKQPFIKPLANIPNMAGKVRVMLQNALSAYVNMDVELAESILHADEEIDDLCDLSLHELLAIMINDSSTINQASQLLYIARCLERAGDHATNIAECVIFLVTGQRIK
jgi:phosphate transport system protein